MPCPAVPCFIPQDVEVWLGSPLLSPRPVASPRRLGQRQFDSLQVPFFDSDVLSLLDPSDGLGCRLRIEARPSPSAPAFCATIP